MKFIGLCLLLGIFAPSALAVEVGEAWSAGPIRHMQQGSLEPQQMQGKVTLINFWATWCAACKDELAEMEQLLKPLFANQDLNVAFVALDKDPKQAVQWMQKNLKDAETMLARLYRDEQFQLADKLAVDSFPMTLIVDRSGKIAFVQRGFTPGSGSTQRIASLTKDLLQGGTKH